MLPGGVPLVMVWIEPGVFMMGRYPGEQHSQNTGFFNGSSVPLFSDGERSVRGELRGGSAQSDEAATSTISANSRETGKVPTNSWLVYLMNSTCPSMYSTFEPPGM